MTETSKQLIAFLDILGFQNKTKAAKDERYIKEIERLIDNEFSSKRNWNINFLEDVHKYIKLNTFSDNLLISCPYDSGNIDRLISVFTAYVANLQLHFAEKNYFIRGGACIGNLYVSKNKNFVCGEGLIKAYKMESEIATFPRIIVSKDFLQLYNEYYINLNGENCLLKPNSSLLQLDFDNLVFIDFYNNSFVKYNKNIQDNLINKKFTNIKSNIINGFINDYSVDNIRKKYEWLISYHNKYCIENHLDKDLYIKDVKDLLTDKFEKTKKGQIDDK